LRTRRSTN